MPVVEPINLAAILRRHMADKKLSQDEVAKKVELSPLTISFFLRSKNSPHRETKEKIEDYLKNEGALTRLGFLTAPLFQQEDKEALKDMGIQPYEKPKLSQHEQRFLTYALYHAHGNQDEKDALLDKILSVLS